VQSQVWLERQVEAFFGPTKGQRLLAFYELLKKANNQQNLTRLIQPEAFFYGHLMDCWHYDQHFGLFPSVDVGSGCGMPGLGLALLRDEPWVLIEKEKQKAAFLRDVATKLSPSTTVCYGRFQDHPGMLKGVRVTARALAPLPRLFRDLPSGVSECVFFKGPAWPSEQPAPPPKQVIEYTIQEKKRYLLVFHVEHTDIP
jgi:16S rRNA G527 N7-methylase RsmG